MDHSGFDGDRAIGLGHEAQGEVYGDSGSAGSTEGGAASEKRGSVKEGRSWSPEATEGSTTSGEGVMEVSQESVFDVHARLTMLGCVQPTTLSILPLNLDTAQACDDLVFPISSATLRKILLKAGLPYQDVLPNDVSKRYRLDRADDVILPPLFVTAQWLYENRTAVKTAARMGLSVTLAVA